MGWKSTGGSRTVSPSVASAAMRSRNSKNCVARNDRVRDRGLRDQLLLRELRAEVAALGQALGADDRQRDVMPHPGGRFGREQVAGRRVEEREHRRVLERGSVRHVDDHGGSRHGLGEPLAGERVDARVG
jgi:hypothetical protein